MGGFVDREIDASVDWIGIAPADQSLDQSRHRRDLARGVGHEIRFAPAEAAHVLEEQPLLAPAEIAPADAVARGPLEDRLVDIGHVLRVSDATATGFQEPREHIEDEERPGVTKVRRVVRGHAADIHRRDLALGTERIGAAPPCVVEP